MGAWGGQVCPTYSASPFSELFLFFFFFNTLISTITWEAGSRACQWRVRVGSTAPRHRYTACHLTGRACYYGRHMLCQESRPNKLE